MTTTRRAFLEYSGGLAIAFIGGRALAVMPGKGQADAAAPGFDPNVFVHVATDGWVTLVCHRSEMGQGVRSTLPALLADEMGADMARVKIAQADGDKKYGDQKTDGSSSIRNGYDDLRRAGATARIMLVAAAARRWNVSPSSCEARDHAVFHGKRSLGFGELAAEAAKLPVPNPGDVKVRPRSELRHVFRDLPLVDAPAIVAGKAQFGADIRLPGMLVAVIARPPVVGGRVARYDGKRALAIPGVKRLVEIPTPKPPYGFQPWGGIAVLAENTWAAMRGRAALEIEWDAGKNADYDSDRYREELSKSVRAPGTVARNVGDVDGALSRAARVVEAEYHVPHLAHVPMEPPAAVAEVKDGKCEVWAPTQYPQEARTQAAKTIGFSEDRVQVHVTFLGGAFGRKAKSDFVAEAALLAREAGQPVRVQWTREDDIHHDYYNAVNTQLLTAGLDERGRLVAWRLRTAFPPISSTFKPTNQPSAGDLQQGVTDRPLAIANVRAETCRADVHVRIGWLRSVYNIFHAFSVNSFIDEIAHARGEDPRDVQLEILGPDRIVTLAELGVDKLSNYGDSLEKHPIDTGRWRRVIERATAMARWDQRRADSRVLGLAAHRSFLTYVAVVVSVVRNDDGQIAIDEAWVATDAGIVVNRERARSQMEGAVIFGISHTFHGGATMKRGATVQSGFHDYRLARIADAPRRISVDIAQSDAPPGGIGEPGVPPVAPAIANAVFALTGRRIRELPLTLGSDPLRHRAAR